MAAVKTATFTVLKINDTTAPTATAATSGNKDQRENFLLVRHVDAVGHRRRDGLRREVDRVRHQRRRVDGLHQPGRVQRGRQLHGRRPRHRQGQEHLHAQQLTFRVLRRRPHTDPRSDEFDGAALGSQWTRHTRNGGTPASAITSRYGQLHMLMPDFEIDAANTTTSRGPDQLHRPGPRRARQRLAGRDRVHGQVHGPAAEHRPDYLERRQQLRPLLDHAQPHRRQHLRRAVQGQQPDPPRGRRSASGEQHHDRPGQGLPDHDPHASHAHQRVQTPSSRSTDHALGRHRDGDGCEPRGCGQLHRPEPVGRRGVRDAAGSRIGIITQSNFPGTTGTHDSKRHARARSTPAWTTSGSPRTRSPARRPRRPPRRRSTRRLRPPATRTTVRSRSPWPRRTPARAPRASTRRSTASPPTGTPGAWTPYVDGVTLSSSGTHVVEYRSTDKAANTETAKSVTVKIQLPICERSDEFEGTRSTRAGCVTPATAAPPPRARSRRGLRRPVLPTNDLEIDAAAGSARSTCSPRTCPHWARTGRSRRSSPRSTGALAEHRPRLGRGQQLHPFHADPQPQ